MIFSFFLSVNEWTFAVWRLIADLCLVRRRFHREALCHRPGLRRSRLDDRGLRCVARPGNRLFRLPYQALGPRGRFRLLWA